MLYDVLIRLAADTGYEPDQQRSALLSLLNNGARDLYNMLECNKIFRETTLVVQPDAIVALPSFVGELRGLRMHTNELPFDLNSIASPRYVTTTLQYKFKNWRDLGESSIHSLPSQVNSLTLTVSHVEDTPATVLIEGETANSKLVQEKVVMDAVSKTTTELFGPTIEKIACFDKRKFNITVKDTDGNELAVLYNTDNKTRYKIIDVSQIFWTLDTNDGQSLIDVCYKIPYRKLLEDSDSFFAGDDYDNAWYWICMYLFWKPQQGKDSEAASALQSCVQAIEAAKDASEKDIVKKMSFGRNKFFGLFRKYRYFPGSVTSVDHNIQS